MLLRRLPNPIRQLGGTVLPHLGEVPRPEGEWAVGVDFRSLVAIDKLRKSFLLP